MQVPKLTIVTTLVLLLLLNDPVTAGRGRRRKKNISRRGGNVGAKADNDEDEISNLRKLNPTRKGCKAAKKSSTSTTTTTTTKKSTKSSKDIPFVSSYHSFSIGILDLASFPVYCNTNFIFFIEIVSRSG